MKKQLKEQLINIDTAKLAKEKGCDLELYDETDWVYFEDGDEFICNYDPRKKHPDAKQVVNCTQSLLQKWLRDIHRIHVEPSPYNTEDFKIYYAVGLLFLDTLTKEDWDADELVNYQLSDMFDSYEDALEIGLQEALKRL